MFSKLHKQTFSQILTIFIILFTCGTSKSITDDLDYLSSSDENFRDNPSELSSFPPDPLPSSTPLPLELQDTHLFSNAILTYDPEYMNKTQNDQFQSSKKNDSNRIDSKMKVWLKDKIDLLIEKIEASEELKNKKDLNEDVFDHEQTIVPLSTLAPNEVYLPIDIEHLVPKNKDNYKNHHKHRDDFEEFAEIPTESSILTKSSTTPSTTTTTSTSSATTSTTTTTKTTTSNESSSTKMSTNIKPKLFHNITQNSVVRILSSGKKNLTLKTSSEPRLWKTQLQALKNISFDVPEKRILASYPMRRLMMAYFAPRILRFQAAMVLSTLMSEVSRKVFDPLVGNLVGSNIAKVISPTAASFTSTTPSTPTTPSILSLLSATGNGNSLSQLTPLIGGLLNNVASSNPPPTQDRSLVAEESTRSEENSLGTIVGLLKQFKPSELQTVTQLITNIDSKQLNSLLSLMQTLSPLLRTTSTSGE